MQEPELMIYEATKFFAFLIVGLFVLAVVHTIRRP
jgi:hypothetical protein